MATHDQQAPVITENYGDLVRLRCRCGNEVTIVPEAQLETAHCDECEAVIWFETRIACGYLDTLSPMNADDLRVMEQIATRKVVG